MQTHMSVVRWMCVFSAWKLEKRKSFKEMEIINSALRVCQYCTLTHSRSTAFSLIRENMNPWYCYNILSREWDFLMWLLSVGPAKWSQMIYKWTCLELCERRDKLKSIGLKRAGSLNKELPVWLLLLLLFALS